MFLKFKKALKINIKFTSISFFSFTTFILFLFYLQTPNSSGIISLLYKFSIFGYYFVILLIINLLLTPLYFFKYLKYLILIPKILLDTFLIIDYFVFKIYRFHIDMLFIKMAISDFNGIGLSPLLSFISFLVLIVIISTNIYFLKKAQKININYLKPVLYCFIILFLFGQVIYIWANYYKQNFIEQYTPYFPYYFPTTSHSLMRKIEKNTPFFLPSPIEKASKNTLLNNATQKALLQYPKKKLHFNKLHTKPNILLIVLESWRADKLTPEIMPHLDSLAKHAQCYNQHYSTGNVTVSGLFGLMYGLHPSYLPYIQSNAYANQSILIKSLKKLNYDIKAYTSSNLNRFSLKAMFFNKIKPSHYFESLKERADKADKKLIKQIKKDLYTEKDIPWFKFIFLTSSHHHYNYPHEFKKFKPIPKNSEGFIFDKNIDPLPFINDYKNALSYEDYLVNQILNILKTTKKIKHTLIIITGDHAEEFNDNHKAYWGHGSNFTLYQTKVPLIIYNPLDSLPFSYNFPTGHIDIVPTLLKDYLGCQNPVSDYSSGINFKTLDNSLRSFIQTSYKDKAYLIDSTIYSTGLFVKSYRVNNIKKTNKYYDINRINELRKAESEFLK